MLLPGNTDMQLRPYQIDLKNKIYRAWKEHRAVMATLATGGGKTILFSAIAKDCVDRNGKVLVMAHREELITQAANKLRGLGLDVGIIKAGYSYEPWKKIQVASVQTIIRRDINIKFTLCIVDEAHHDQSDNSYGTIRKRLVEMNPDMFTLGVTATPIRLNGAGFKDIYETLIKGITVKQLIERGYLSPPKYLTFPYINLGKIKKTGGDFNLKELSESYQDKIPADFLVKDYLTHAKGLQTIVFAIDVAHSQEIKRAYSTAGIKIAHIDGKTPDIERQKIIKDFAEKKINVVTNVGIFTEGYDCPGIEAVQLARPTESLSLYMQMSGRGLRTADGKENCLILDRANCIITHGLLEADREWELGKDSGTKKNTKVVAKDMQTGIEYDIRSIPSNINPEFIELREVDLTTLATAGEYMKFRQKFYKLKYFAFNKKFNNKWIWYRLVDSAKSPEQVKIASEIYVNEFAYKQGMVKYLVEEYNEMQKKLVS